MKTQIPILAETDLLILGGSTGAVEAAVAARAAGAKVFLATPFTYVGDDVCANLRLWLDRDQTPQTDLAKEVFGDCLAQDDPPTPMSIKYKLEQALVDAGVELLYMTYPGWLLRDDSDQVVGAVVANRSGFQVITAKAVIDATDRALAARKTAATFRELPAGTYSFRRTVVGGEAVEIGGAAVKELPGIVRIEDREYTALEYQLPLELADASAASSNAVEVKARLLTWHPDQMLASDRLFALLPDRLDTGAQQTALGDGLDLAACQCGNERLFVLGANADVTDDVAAELMKPCNLMAAGKQMGTCVAAMAADVSIGAVQVDYDDLPTSPLEVCRKDRYFRLNGSGIELDLNRVATLGEFDVVIAGGGTAGAPAGIAAGRAGAEAVILEFQPGLGGIGTEGRISSYYHGNRCGFTTEMDEAIYRMGPNPEFPVDRGRWNTEWKRQWYLREADKAGTRVWFGSLNVAAAVEGNAVCGILTATPYGFGLVKSKANVDATGGTDIAAAAGAETVTVSKAHVAVQGTGLSPFIPGNHYTNTDHTFVDETDVLDITRAFLVARKKLRDCFDLAQIVNSRERRQIVGDTTLEALGFLAGRTYPDTIVTSRSNFDSHGFTIHPVFMAKPPDKESLQAHVPIRCLLPKGLEGVLATGLGISCHRDALPVVRMQPDVQNQGYSAGRAAAMAALANQGIRDIDIKELQAHLVEIGILETDVPDHEDSFPVPSEKIADAVENGIDTYLGLAIIFAHPEQSVPLLQDAYGKAAGDAKVQLARILGLLGDDTGIDLLVEELTKRDWDEGWNYRGMGQFGFSLSEVDTLLIAAARSGNPQALPVMLDKLGSLDPDREFSHFRALTIAFEAQPSGDAAPGFARLLSTEQVKGKAKQSIAEALADVPEEWNDTSRRNSELKELLIARGLYACGDHDGKAREVLEAYKKDLHGHYARHARAILGQ